jgi:hypothetical protein
MRLLRWLVTPIYLPRPRRGTFGYLMALILLIGLALGFWRASEILDRPGSSTGAAVTLLIVGVALIVVSLVFEEATKGR